MGREWLTNVWLKLKALVNRGRLERDLDEELQFHLAMQEERNLALGLTRDDARAAAQRRFGNVTFLKEDCRELWVFSWVETLWKDIHYAARILAKSPGFVAVVICSLALGIGANTAVFSAMNAVLLPATPYEHPEALATIWSINKLDSSDDEDVVPILVCNPYLEESFAWKKVTKTLKRSLSVMSFGRQSSMETPEYLGRHSALTMLT
jgi:hypothetical protein